ncbi:MAG: GNAT family protein [Candidatus Magasanikiibacteriota bacterium]
MKVPILQGNKVTLRTPKIVDVKEYVYILSDKKVSRFLNHRYTTKNHLNESKKWVKEVLSDPGQALWTITVGDKIIGNATLRFVHSAKKANLGIVIGGYEQWGRGYGTESINLLMSYLFGKLKYNRLDLFVHCNNRRGINLYNKIGFKREGRVRQSTWNPDTKKFVDQYLMSILKDEWFKKNKK